MKMKYLVETLFIIYTLCNVQPALNEENTFQLYNELSNYFNDNWSLISCGNQQEIYSKLMKYEKKQRLHYMTNTAAEGNKFLFHENVIWDFDSCAITYNVFDMLIEIEDVPITKHWIIIHNDNSTIFHTKLNQNIVHYLKESATFLEWKEISKQVEIQQIIGNLTRKIEKKVMIDDLMGVNLKVLTDGITPLGTVLRNKDEVLNRKPQVTSSGDEIIPLEKEDVFGLSIDILTLMQNELNFTVDLFLRKDRQWGALDKNTGSWSGVVGSLVKNEADMFASTVSLTPERAQVVSFLPPIFLDFDTVFIKERDLSFTNTYTLPFSAYLWLCITVQAAALGVLIYLTGIGYDKKKVAKYLDQSFQVTETLILTLSTTFGKGFWRTGKYAKIFVFMACFTGSFFFMAYRASLTSKLAIRKTELPFGNMMELYNSDYNLYIWKSNGFFEDSVRNPINGTYKFWASEKAKQNKDGDPYLSVEKGVTKLHKESVKNAFFVRRDILYFNQEVDKCNLKIAFNLGEQRQAFAVRKNSEYYPLFSTFTKSIKKNGILNQLALKYRHEGIGYQDCTSGDLDIGLGFDKLGSLWMMLFIAYILAVMMFVVEICRRKQLYQSERLNILVF